MDLGLTGKVAVVTGGSVGIGLAVAAGLAAEGAHLVLAARGAKRLEEAAEAIRAAHGVRCVPVACDVATADGVALSSPLPRRSSAGPTSSSAMRARARTRPSSRPRTRNGRS